LTASRDPDDLFKDYDYQDGKDGGEEFRPTCADDVQAVIYLAEQVLAYEDLKKACEKARLEEMERWNKELETNWKLKRGKELDEALNDHRTPMTTE